MKFNDLCELVKTMEQQINNLFVEYNANPKTIFINQKYAKKIISEFIDLNNELRRHFILKELDKITAETSEEAELKKEGIYKYNGTK